MIAAAEIIGSEEKGGTQYMTPFYWLILFILLLGIEILTMGLTTIWFAGGALLAFFVSLFGGGLVFQAVVFIGVSLILLAVTRPLATKYLNRRTVKTNAESLAGRDCVVQETIDNLRAEGTVTVDGVVWTARSREDDRRIQAGTVVTIVEIQGVKLIVEPKQNKEETAWQSSEL